MDGGIPEDRTRRGRQRQWDRQAETLMNVYMTLDLQIILETVLVTRYLRMASLPLKARGSGTAGKG